MGVNCFVDQVRRFRLPPRPQKSPQPPPQNPIQIYHRQFPPKIQHELNCGLVWGLGLWRLCCYCSCCCRSGYWFAPIWYFIMALLLCLSIGIGCCSWMAPTLSVSIFQIRNFLIAIVRLLMFQNFFSLGTFGGRRWGGEGVVICYWMWGGLSDGRYLQNMHFYRLRGVW